MFDVFDLEVFVEYVDCVLDVQIEDVLKIFGLQVLDVFQDVIGGMMLSFSEQ